MNQPARHGTTMSTSHEKRARSGGFTLVELMVVVVILGSLVALVGPRVWNALFESRNEIAKTQMHRFKEAIEMYHLKHKELPGSLEDLTQTTDRNPEPIMEKIPQDPWGMEYEYTNLGKREFRIRSAGDDKEMGTEDDLTYPEETDRRRR